MRSRRIRASRPGAADSRASPSNLTAPRVGRSIPARSDSSVDFPDPDSPVTTTNSPRSMARVTSASAVTLVPGWGNSFHTPVAPRSAVTPPPERT